MDLKNERVLVCSGIQVFPPESGGQWRTASLCQSLAKHNDVRVYSLTGRKKDYLARAGSVLTFRGKGLSEFIDRTPVFAVLQWLCYRMGIPPLWLVLVAGLRPPLALREELSKATVVVVDFPFLFPLWRFSSGRRVLNTHNLEHRLAKAFLRPVVRAIERIAARKCDTLLCCSKEDGEWFAVPTKVEVYKNSADPNRFRLSSSVREQTRATLGFTAADRVILFSGSAYQPNVEAVAFLKAFCRENKSEIEKLRLRFLVIGTVCPPFSENQISALGKVERVEPYFLAADAAINPVESGSGTNVKMYEYLAAELPVFSTPFGARGIEIPAEAPYVSFDRKSLLGSLASWQSERVT